jgi:hypothetical protein
MMKQIFSALMLGCLVAFVTGTNFVSAKQDNLATDQTAFRTTTAQQARSSGSPVGPPAKVTLCHKGVTIEVAEPAVPSLLAQGDTLGPCPDDSTQRR